MKIKYIFLLFVFGFALAISSCEKFLEETPTGSLTDQSSVTSAKGGAALAAGCYFDLTRWTMGGPVWAYDALPCAFEYPTGKAYSQYMSTELWKYETNVEAGECGYFTYPWTIWYSGIRTCNLALQMLPGVTGLSVTEKNKLLGEVRTLRAFYYFCLVRYYGDVIYNVKVATDVNQAMQPRTSLKTIYDKIIVPDLEYAINESGLVDTRSTGGEVTKLVARTILADVYLTMAGYPYQEVNASTDTTKKWCVDGLWTMKGYPINTPSAIALLQKAKTQLDFLYGKYPIGNFSDLPDPKMNNKGGAIFQGQYLAGTRNNDLVSRCLPIASQVSVTGENGAYFPSVAYHDSFNPADKRVQDRVYFFYSDTYAKKWDPNERPAGKFPLPAIYKFYDYDAIKNTGQSGLNWTFYRYADVLLMQTEVNWCLKQLGQSIPDADIVKGINEVRTRATLPNYLATDLTLLDIMSERAYELIFENRLLWDMLRTRKVLVDGSGKFASITDYVGHQPTNFNFQFSVKHLLMPISGFEISNNKNCLQNYGWSPKQTGQQ